MQLTSLSQSALQQVFLLPGQFSAQVDISHFGREKRIHQPCTEAIVLDAAQFNCERVSTRVTNSQKINQACTFHDEAEGAGCSFFKRHGRAILTHEQAQAIFRCKPLPSAKDRDRAGILARAYGVSVKTVRDIWVGRTWYRATFHLDPTKPFIPERLQKRAGRPRGAKDRKPRSKKLQSETHDSDTLSACSNDTPVQPNDTPVQPRAQDQLFNRTAATVSLIELAAPCKPPCALKPLQTNEPSQTGAPVAALTDAAMAAAQLTAAAAQATGQAAAAQAAAQAAGDMRAEYGILALHDCDAWLDCSADFPRGFDESFPHDLASWPEEP
jgi:hypothetical protein